MRPEESQAEQLALAGAPTDLEGLRAHLLDRFGITHTVAQLKAMATVTPEMLISPAERGPERKGRRR